MEKFKVLICILVGSLLLPPEVMADNDIDLGKIVQSMAMISMNVSLTQLPQLLVAAITGSVPFLLQNFGQLTMPLQQIFQMISDAGTSTSLINQAFSSLNLGFSALSKLFTDIVPVTFDLFKNLGLSLLDVLSTVLRTILNDLLGFLKVVELLNLNPTQLQNLLLLGSEQDLFTFISSGVFTQSSLLSIADILNIDLTFSGVLGFFQLFNFDFAMKFCQFVTNDILQLVNVLGLVEDVLGAALSVLNIVTQILDLDFIKDILALVTGQQLLANIVSPTTALTKKGNLLMSIFVQLSQFVDMAASPLGGGGSLIPISFQDLGNFTQILSLAGPLSDVLFSTTGKIAQKDLLSCVVTELASTDILGVVTSAVFDGGIFKIPTEGISQLVEGTPLVCSDFLMGILDSIDNLFFNFKPLQPVKVVKTYDFRNPFFDILTRLITFGHYYMWLILVNIYLMLKDYITE